jgi:hypothetical protein
MLAARRMNSVQEAITTQFYNWERRGRGWQVLPDPVSPEPPFHPFPGLDGDGCRAVAAGTDCPTTWRL